MKVALIEEPDLDSSLDRRHTTFEQPARSGDTLAHLKRVGSYPERHTKQPHESELARACRLGELVKGDVHGAVVPEVLTSPSDRRFAPAVRRWCTSSRQR